VKGNTKATGERNQHAQTLNLESNDLESAKFRSTRRVITGLTSRNFRVIYKLRAKWRRINSHRFTYILIWDF